MLTKRQIEQRQKMTKIWPILAVLTAACISPQPPISLEQQQTCLLQHGRLRRRDP
jgi:hypothetical protein